MNPASPVPGVEAKLEEEELVVTPAASVIASLVG